MLTTEEAFSKFRSRLELNDKEQSDASERQNEIRDHIGECFDIDEDFLTGSYARHTKTKPLKDVDIFCVLGEEEGHYRNQQPSVLLSAFGDALAKKYGRSCVNIQRRSVGVDFGVHPDADDKTDYRVVSVDVVPAFAVGKNYEIPDTAADSGWTNTNPRIHADLALAAQKTFSNEWKGLVRMMKYWNNHNAKTIKPSFLIEVMALDLLHPPFNGSRSREMQSFFASLRNRLGETWEDPAGLGPPISDRMDVAQTEIAKTALQRAERTAAHAINAASKGNQGEALRTWRELFGPLFPLS
jgi:hypothetical protein